MPLGHAGWYPLRRLHLSDQGNPSQPPGPAQTSLSPGNSSTALDSQRSSSLLRGYSSPIPPLFSRTFYINKENSDANHHL